jgi:hypothetical protein
MKKQPLPDIPPDRPGLPAPESIESVEPFTTPQHEQFQIIHTTEVDAYDKPPKPKPKPKRARRKNT